MSRDPHPLDAPAAEPVAAPAAPRELELKLELAAADASRLLRHPLLRRMGQGRSTTRALRSLYYDTSDLALFRAGLVLRVRLVGRQYVQTVKTLGGGRGGLFERTEVETPLAGSEPDPTRVTDPEIRSLLIAETLQRGRELGPVLETDVRRTRRRLAGPDGEVELSLDAGEIRTRSGALPVHELELEHVSGERRVLFDVALALLESVELRPAAEGKAERGLAQLCGLRPEPLRARRPALPPHATLEQAVEAILAACFEQIAANRAPAWDGHDPEGVHQMRVGVRRLRSALSLFRRVLPAESVGPLRDELRWLAAELGGARDADVFCEEVLEPIFRRRPDDRALKRLREEAGALRGERQAALRVALDSRRATAVLLRVGRFLEGRAWRDQPLSEDAARLFAPAREFADKVLARRHARAKELGRDVAARSEAERHELRIRLKKLRYASEFWSGLYPHKRAERYARRLARLQDDLGHLNDVATAQRLLDVLLERLGAERSVEHERAAGFVCGWLGAQADHSLGVLAKRWERFAATDPFWA